MAARIGVRRVYDPPRPDDGYRVLVDRLWPRGISKAVARLDEWAREIAPSTDLRKRFSHEAGRWDEFRTAYGAELAEQPEAVAHLLDRVRQGRVTLLYAARDTERNNAVALREYLERRLR